VVSPGTGMGCRVESELVQCYSWTPVVYTLDGGAVELANTNTRLLALWG